MKRSTQVNRVYAYTIVFKSVEGHMREISGTAEAIPAAGWGHVVDTSISNGYQKLAAEKLRGPHEVRSVQIERVEDHEREQRPAGQRRVVPPQVGETDSITISSNHPAEEAQDEREPSEVRPPAGVREDSGTADGRPDQSRRAGGARKGHGTNRDT
jgi:hypothetical protein